MKLWPTTALGIYISRKRINLALLKQTKAGLELVRSVSGPVPDGAIEGGNIARPVVLARAARELQNRNKMRTSRAAASLFASPVLSQIMEMPKQIPANIRQFVEDEVKNYVVLSSGEIAFDFCGVDSSQRSGENRLFVVAADGQRIAAMAKAFAGAGLDIEAIEPPAPAYARAFFAKRIAGKFDCNVLMAIIEDGVLTLCVFRNQCLDFVRTKDIDRLENRPVQFCGNIAKEMNAIVQFYDIEVPDSTGKWEAAIIVEDSVQLPPEAQESLAGQVGLDNLEIITGENTIHQMPIVRTGASEAAGVSPAAVGLAMGLFGTNKTDLSINLIPQEVVETKALKTDTLISANIAAAVLLVVILIVVWLSMAIGKTNKNLVHKKRAELSQQMRTLLTDRELLDGLIKQTVGRIESMNKILSSRHNPKWLEILNDVSIATPRTVRITRLTAGGNAKMLLKGAALSYDDVYLFMDMLNKSKHIKSASLIETEKEKKHDGLVRYAISCPLAGRKGK